MCTEIQNKKPQYYYTTDVSSRVAECALDFSTIITSRNVLYVYYVFDTYITSGAVIDAQRSLLCVQTL